MHRKWITVAVAVSIAAIVTLIQAVRDIRGLPPEFVMTTSTLLPWLANVAASIVVSGAGIAGYLVISRRGVALFLFTILLPVFLFVSMLPVYSAVRYGAPAEWQYVCPNETQAYAAPLAVLVSLLVLPVARWWRGV